MLVVKQIIRIGRGRFEKRHPIAPTTWPHFDLLWVHRGTVVLHASSGDASVKVSAPSGVLIAPHTEFSGSCTTADASASICHFEATGTATVPVMHCIGQDSFLAQAMVTLGLRYHDEGVAQAVQERLLQSILDNVFVASERSKNTSEATAAWDMAAQDLSRTRTLADVAAHLSMSESRFRAIHRTAYPSSAGQHLLALRMRTAAELLATTGCTITQISQAVGYAHPESLTQAFAKFHGLTPRDYRAQAVRFA